MALASSKELFAWGLLAVGMWIVLSVIAGYLGANSIGIVLVAAGLAAVVQFRIVKKIVQPSTQIQLQPLDAPTKRIIAGGALFVFGIFVLILFGVQHGYDLSADAAAPFAAQLIHGNIPSTYAPYFDLPFLYQLGLPLLVSQLAFLPIPLHQLSWFLGLAGLILYFIFLVAIAHSRSAMSHYHAWTWKHALLVFALFWCMRLPFQNLLVGEYPLLLAAGLALGVIWLSDQWSSWARGLLWAAVAVIHPYAAVMGFILWASLDSSSLKTLVSNAKKYIVTGLFGALFFLPVIFFQFLPYLNSAGGGHLLDFQQPSISNAISGFFLAGPLLIAIFFIVITWRWKKGEVWIGAHENPYFVSIIGAAILYFFFSCFPNIALHTKLIEIVSMGLILFLAQSLPRLVPADWQLRVWVALGIIALLVLFSSSTMENYIHGTKSTVREAIAADTFNDQFPGIEKVVFASKGSAKMSQYAHKIPIDPAPAHFLSNFYTAGSRSPEVIRLLSEAQAFKDALKNKCTTCMRALGAKYVVVDTRVFPPLDSAPIWESDGFVAYAATP